MVKSRTMAWLAVPVAAGLLLGCETSKSANPLSPSVAGPIAGVTITAPKLLEPAQGWSIESPKQPITLLIENASSTGARPLSYRIQVAADAEFTNAVFAREGVSPGTGGRTSLKLPDALASPRTYYWRARAEDGANTGPFSEAASFSVFTPVSLDAPVLVSPAAGSTIPVANPTFVVKNAARQGAAGPVSYTVQIGADEAFSQGIAQIDGAEQANQTQLTGAFTLPYARTLYWRVRAYEASFTGPWSATWTFRTEAAPLPAPTPTPTPTPTPGPTPTPTPTPPSPGGPIGPPRTISTDEALSIAEGVHNVLRYDLSDDHAARQFWIAAVAVIHYGHSQLNPRGPDSDWCIKDAGGGRPISNDTLVRCSTRHAYDMGAFGVGAWHFGPIYDIGVLPGGQNVYPPPSSALPR